MNISIDTIKELRLRTNVSMGLCKKVLEETGGDVEKAIEKLRIAGEIKAQDISERAASEGAVVAYIHPGNQMGAIVKVLCESDFVARSEDFLAFANDIAMHVVASKPLFVDGATALHSDWALDENALILEQMKLDPKMAKKPPEMLGKIASGKLDKRLKEVTLLDQPFIKDPSKTVEELRAELVLKVGENIKVAGFKLFSVRGGA